MSSKNATPRHIIVPQDCTGCGLCANVCSRNAIRMVWSTEGFLIPSVETHLCIECGVCTRQCIALEEKSTYNDDIDTVTSYGGWHKNTHTHIQSSSGGIFTAIAEYVLSTGGCVFGVVWQDKYTAVFDKVERIEELARMRGSKYTPALPGMVYQQVRTELKANRDVLFSGTPCQVHALRKYLGRPYENLITIDIVCHGAPSHLILERYINEDEAKSGKTIEYVSFRDKPEGWMRFHVTRHYTDGSSASEPLDKDMYMTMFLCDKALNKVCYNCPYAHIPRQGDITLGDYWGVQAHHPEWPVDKGISAILANTDQGHNILSQVSHALELHSEPFRQIHGSQGVVYIRPQTQIPEQRDRVLSKLAQWPLRKVYLQAVDAARFGSIYMARTTIFYRILRIIYRGIRFIKRKLS